MTDSPEEMLLRSIFSTIAGVCVRGCTFTDDEGTEWGKPAKWGALCGSCYWRIRYRLAEAPKIVVALRTTMVPLQAGAVEAGVSGSRDRKVPFLESQAPAADAFFGVLVDWAASHAEALGGNAAVALPASAWRAFESRENSRGLPAGLSPQGAAERTRVVVEWLTRFGPQIAGLGSVVAYHDDVVSQVARHRSLAGLVAPRPRVKGRTCPTCFEGVVEVIVPDEGQMVARCAHCREVFEAAEDVAEGEEVAA